MTLPPEVVKEIDFLVGKVYGAGYDGNRLDKSLTEEIQRLCLLTRRLTIEECAKVCESNPYCSGDFLAIEIRQLEEK